MPLAVTCGAASGLVLKIRWPLERPFSLNYPGDYPWRIASSP
jgi:hypothetical protein